MAGRSTESLDSIQSRDMTTDPYQTPSAPLEAPRVEVPPLVTEQDIFEAWFPVMFVGGIGGVGAGAVVGGLIGGLSGAAGVPFEKVTLAIDILSFLAGVSASYLAFRYFVRRLVSQALEKAASKDAV